MIYVGIDVAKDKHDCHFVSHPDGEVLCDNLQISNSLEGFNQLFNTILEYSNNDLSQVKVGLESTGHYSTNIFSYLKRQRVNVVELNPLSVNRFRKSLTLRNTKTDKCDARFIARILFSLEETTNPTYDLSYHIAELKSLTRCRYRLNYELQPIKNRYRRSLQLVFPEFEKHFNISIPAAFKLISKYPSPKDILSVRKSKLEKFLKEISHGHWGKYVDTLVSIAKDSIGSTNVGDVFELKHIAKEILFLETELDSINEQISLVMAQINSPITTIPGIGDVLGATILAELKDIQNFDTPEQIQAFAGCDPSIYQSGKYNASITPMAKKGSAYLRNAIYLATSAAFVQKGQMYTYVKKKCSQGKHFYTAMSHGMKKMIRIIFSVLKNNKPYIEPVV